LARSIIVGGPASPEIATSLSKILKLPLVSVNYRDFPDTETRITVNERVDGSTVILVQSTYPPVDKHLMELFFLAHHLSQEGAKVHAVIPYLAYARQDKQFLPGEVVSLGVIAHLLRSVGVSRVTTVDIHSAEGLSLFSIPIYSASAIPSLVQYTKKNLDLKSPLVISPDFGASKRTEAFATVYGAKFLQLSKQRDRTSGAVTMESKDLVEVRGNDVLIVDDIISTGGTIKAAAELLRKAEAKRIFAVCSHPLLIGDAYEKLIAMGVDGIIGTNTVPSRVSNVDVSEVIASHLRTLAE
jgi:ribose-phosphate pyrophosphokinase